MIDVILGSQATFSNNRDMNRHQQTPLRSDEIAVFPRKLFLQKIFSRAFLLKLYLINNYQSCNKRTTDSFIKPEYCLIESSGNSVQSPIIMKWICKKSDLISFIHAFIEEVDESSGNDRNADRIC